MTLRESLVKHPDSKIKISVWTTRKIVSRVVVSIRKRPLLTLPFLWLLYCFALVLTNAIPDRLVKDSIAGGLAQLESEGDHPWIFSTPQSQLDNFTDKIMLQQSQRTSGWNLITGAYVKHAEWSALNSHSLHNPLYAAFANQGYPRYWHGYTVILKPLLVMFNYSVIRTISFVMLTFILCLAFSEIRKEFGTTPAFCMVVVLTSVNIFVVPLSLTFAPVFYIVLITLSNIKAFVNKKNRIVLFLIIGSVTNFLDFLTVPALTLCIPLAFITLYDTRNPTSRPVKTAEVMLRCAGAWLLAYASTWSAKWLLSTVILRENVISDALHSILVRSDTGGVNEAKGLSFDKLTTISDNVNFMFEIIPVRLVALVVCGLMVSAIFGFVLNSGVPRSIATNAFQSLPLLLIATVPLIWYIALSNHSTIHMQFYAYKNLGITILCLLLFITELFYTAKRKTVQEHDVVRLT